MQDMQMGALGAQVMSHEHCLVLVRHGQTPWNMQDRLTTRSDIDLSDTGVQQALQLADSLAGVRFDRALASPKRRAFVTGQIALTKTQDAPELIADERLIEPDAGPFEGCVFSELRTGTHASAFARYQSETDPQFPDGCETAQQTAARAQSLLDELTALPGRTLVASHGAFLRVLVCVFLGMDPALYRRFKLDNATASLIKLYPQPPHQLVALNLRP
jgi:probable phosphoglycerate mutase